MSFDPSQPINPNDLTYYQIDVKCLIDELEQRLVNLQSMTAPENFSGDFARGEHAGQIAELQSVILRVKANMYFAPPPTRP